MNRVDVIDRFHELVSELIEEIRTNERENVKKAGEVIADAIAEGRGVWVIGTGGHSQMGAEEIFNRAGGLAPVTAILDPGIWIGNGGERSMFLERTLGFAEQVLRPYDLRKGDVMIMTTAYGINTMTIETANMAKKKGLTIVAITSPGFSKAVPPDHPARHPSKKNLFEIADIVIDSYMPWGDAALEIEGSPEKTCPMSTLGLVFAEWCLMAQVVENLVKKGITPPIYMSGNIPGGDEYYKRLREKYPPKHRSI